MPCYSPLKAWRAAAVNPSGKRGLVFSPRDGIPYRQLEVPCGQCIGCRLERSRQWAIRCVHEGQLHAVNSFVTLTYDDAHFPAQGSLQLRDFQLFMKRLRKSRPESIRFFHCGEYGSELNRPHYHSILFGIGFPDRQLWSVRNGEKLYRSEALEKLWPFGFSTVGDLTFESAAYVARYVTKKVTGRIADSHYLGRKPEYVTMSRRPGIGSKWYAQFSGDVFPSDEVIIRGGVRCRPPKFYDKLLEADAPEVLRRIKITRELRAEASPDNSGTRLRIRGEVKQRTYTLLKRGYENGS
ncbi:hypothetical protein CCP3SC15_2050003 [Gammaproteobacteria bacterium]